MTGRIKEYSLGRMVSSVFSLDNLFCNFPDWLLVGGQYPCVKSLVKCVLCPDFTQTPNSKGHTEFLLEVLGQSANG